MKLIAAVVALVIAASTLGPIRASAADNLDLSPQPASAALARAIDLVDRAVRATGVQQGDLARQALAELDARPELADETWLREPLAANPPKLATAKARLTAALALLVAGTTNPANSDAARQQLDQVLADGRFHPRDWLALVPAFLLPLALLVQAAVQLIWSIVRWPFDRLLDLLSLYLGGPAFGPSMAVAGLLVAIGVVALYRNGLRAAIVAQAETATPREVLPLTSAKASAAAQVAADLGLYREACHFLFLSLLLWIEEQGVVRFDRAATNRENLERLATAATKPMPALVEALELVVGQFDRIWYGGADVTVDDYRQLRELVERARTLAE